MPTSLAQFLSLLIVIADVGLLLALLGLLIPSIRRWIRRVCEKRGIALVFFVALLSMLGSLALSEISGYAPCDLCWYQRILMYPLVILFGLALLKKNRDVRLQGIVLSILGGILAIYHVILQLGAPAIVPCSTRVFAISCGTTIFRFYGY
ncbi:MAG: disulfide bond formation protein B, partial [bacterium]